MARIIEEIKNRLDKIVRENELGDMNIEVRARILSPEEAIGKPEREDYPIVVGKERVIEARAGDSAAHAFTDTPAEFSGTLSEVLDMELENNAARALFAAAANAVLKELGVIGDTIHCRDEEPEKCAEELAAHIKKEKGDVKVGLIGLNPAVGEALSENFGPENLIISDLNRDNVGKRKFGVEVWDGMTETGRLIRESDVAVITGTTLVNGTIDDIMGFIEEYGRDYYLYGVTIAGAAHLLGLNRLCFYGRDE